MFYQQGDVLIESVKSIPKNANKIKPDSSNGHILAKEDATSNTHKIVDISVSNLFKQENKMFLNVKKNTIAKLSHDEHKPIYIESGNYVVRKVREYDPFEKIIRDVMD